MELFNTILMLLAGIGIFLAGINMLTATLKKNASHQLRKTFKKVGNNRFAGFAIGTGLTALIQSSTAVTVMTVGLVNVGILTLFQATTIIMGANLGATLTSLLVSLSTFKIKYIFMAFAFVGLVCRMISKKEKWQFAAEILIGLGIIFVGLNMMSSAFSESAELRNFFSGLFETANFPLLLILIGLVFTAIIHSSAASMAIYISMAASGLLSFSNAAFLILGTSMGTTFTALISSINASANAKRAAMTHLLYNVFLTILFTAIIWPFGHYLFPLYQKLIPSAVWQISVFQLLVHVVTVSILIWFVKPLNKLVGIIIKDNKIKSENDPSLFTSEELLATPSIALEQTLKGINFLGARAKGNAERAIYAFNTGDLSHREKAEKEEELINTLSHLFSSYLVRISSADISSADQKLAASLHNVINDLARIGDKAMVIYSAAIKKHAHNIKLDNKTTTEVNEMFSKVIELFDAGLNSDFLNSNPTQPHEIAGLNYEIEGIKSDITDKLAQRQKDKNASSVSEYFHTVVASCKTISEHLMHIDSTLHDLNNTTKKA